MSTVEVRCATESEIAEIWHLAYTQYVQRGYIPRNPEELYVSCEHLEWIEQTTPLVAIADKAIIGTITITLDGPMGLPMERDYPTETARERQAGRPLASCWRLATANECHSSHRVSTMLMHTTAAWLMERGEPTLLMECHPRHANYYRKRIGFEKVAERSDTIGLTDAPSVLMVGRQDSYSRIAKE